MKLGKPALFIGQVALLHLLVAYHALANDPNEQRLNGEVLSKRILVPTPTPAVDGHIEAKTQAPSKKNETRQLTPATDVITPGAMNAASLYEADGRVLADLDHGWSGQTTLNPWLNRRAKAVLKRGRVAVGAVAILDVRNGDVLALADEFDPTNPATQFVNKEGPANVALRKIAPSASIFKLVSAATLLDSGLSANQTFRYTYAKRRVIGRHLEKPEANAERDDLAGALARSNNGWFARVTNKKLSRDHFVKALDRFWFNKVVPFPILTDASAAQVPRNRLERARMSAGFGHTEMTALHAAVVTAAIATDGQLPTPRLVSQLHGPRGEVIESPARQPLGRAMTEKTAKTLRKMLTKTIDTGTARRAFKKWPSKLNGIKVGGKTGTLARRRDGGYIGFTWFIAYAPADNPEIAIAVMVGNSEKWWQRAVDIGRDILASYFSRKNRGTITAQNRPKRSRTTR